MRLPAGLVVVPLRGECVLLMPIGLTGAHHVTARFVDRHGGVDAEVELQEPIDKLVPGIGATFCGLIPKAADLPETMLFVVVVVVVWKVLNGLVVEERLEETVVVGHHVETQFGCIERIHTCHTGLRQVVDSTEAVLMGLINESFHDRGRKRGQL